MLSDAHQLGFSLPVTPVFEVPRLAPAGRRLIIKYEGANPLSHTFKDRGAVAAVAEAVAEGRSGILAGTCSNMGTAVASACARVGMPCWVVTSAKAPTATRNAIAAFATRQWIVGGGFDEVNTLVSRLAAAVPRLGCINTSLNRPFRNGFKAIMPELIHQMPPGGSYCLIVPTADGTLLGALGEALEEARAVVRQRGQSWRLVLAQPEGCMPLVRAWQQGALISPWTEGDSGVVALSVREPFHHGPAALEALENSGGFAVGVPEANIAGLARQASAATGLLFDLVGGVLAGAITAAAERIPPDETLIGLFTGNGLTTAADHGWAELPNYTVSLEMIQSDIERNFPPQINN